MKLSGLSIEVKADVTKTLLQVSATLNREKATEDLKEEYLRCFCPELENQVEELKKKVNEQIVRDGDKMRIAASVKETVSPSLIQALNKY